MPADETPEQEALSTTDEPQEEEDVEGHTFSLAQDPDFGGKALSADKDDAPPKSDYRI